MPHIVFQRSLSQHKDHIERTNEPLQEKPLLKWGELVPSVLRRDDWACVKVRDCPSVIRLLGEYNGHPIPSPSVNQDSGVGGKQKDDRSLHYEGVKWGEMNMSRGMIHPPTCIIFLWSWISSRYLGVHIQPIHQFCLFDENEISSL